VEGEVGKRLLPQWYIYKHHHTASKLVELATDNGQVLERAPQRPRCRANGTQADDRTTWRARRKAAADMAFSRTREAIVHALAQSDGDCDEREGTGQWEVGDCTLALKSVVKSIADRARH
jgi:hypothetical protein